MTRQRKQAPPLLYEFYSISPDASQIEHIGTSNSYAAGRYRILCSIVDRVSGSASAQAQTQTQEQHMPIYTRYKGDPYSAKHGECIMMFIKAKGRLFSVGIRILEEKDGMLKSFDCRATFATIYKTHRGTILEGCDEY